MEPNNTEAVYSHAKLEAKALVRSKGSPKEIKRIGLVYWSVINYNSTDFRNFITHL